MASNSEEPMDIDNDVKLPLPRADHTAVSSSGQAVSSSPSEQCQNNKDVAELKVSVTVTDVVEQKKFRSIITKTLQSWANKNGVKGEFTATELSDDLTTAVISVEPASALTQLHELCGKELTTREQKTFSIRPIIENDVNKTSQVDQKSSVKSSINLSNEDHVNSQESSADQDNDKCSVALGPYWYMKNSYPNEMQRIEEKNGVIITEKVEVSIKAHKKGANLKKASDQFIKLVQSLYSESSGLSIPLKNVGPEEWKDTLKFLQTTDHKCQITVSPDQITIFGPQQYQTAISKSLQRTRITTNLTDEERGNDQERENVKMYNYDNDEHKTPNQNKIKLSQSIRDPHVIDGLSVEKYYWEIITNQHKKELDRMKEKFNVQFKVVDTAQDKIVIKVCYKRSEGIMQMESHAVRALLRLYQKVATSQFMKNNGMFDDAEDLFSSFDETKGMSGEMNTPDGGDVKKLTGAETKKDEQEEDRCPVCLDSFTKKTRLKSCKHEFCEDCLERSVQSQGSMCPVCKDVFGLVEGDQPNGTMNWLKRNLPLPGFEHCGSIEITYDIPSGTQTAKHPNPGQRYTGLHRIAYLPDNREGNEVLQLLKRAFDQKLIFTVGTSRTTGAENMVTWNDIHHKTSKYGGSESYGYPDPNYLSRVKEELKAKGIK